MQDFSSFIADSLPPGIQLQSCRSGQVAVESFGAIDLQHESLRLSKAGRHQEAKAKAKSSIEARLKIHGPKSLHAGVGLQLLAEVEGDLGNHQEAFEVAKRAMKIREGLRGEELDAAVSRHVFQACAVCAHSRPHAKMANILLCPWRLMWLVILSDCHIKALCWL